MSENLLIALLKLFAFITAMHSEVMVDHTRSFIEKLLRKDLHLQNYDYYLKKFQEFYEQYLKNSKEILIKEDEHKILNTICISICSNLPIKQRISIIVHLLQFTKYYQINHFYGFKTDHRLHDAINYIASEFRFNKDDYHSLSEFIFENLHQIKDKKNLLLAGNLNIFPEIKFIYRLNLQAQIYFLYLPSVKVFMFYYNGDQSLELNYNKVFPLTIYLFQKSSVISSEKILPIYYHEVIENYLENIINEPLQFSAIDIEYRFNKSDNGIKKLTMHGESGELLGIMGASGTGKTTLMNILNGTIKPQKGSILINGHSIYDENINFQNVIGFVPQDDLLVEELTVYKNLYYNAKLCFKNFTNIEIENKVNDLLLELDLFDIRNLKVGSVLDKFISGGQRKRLNIALELIREPAILLLDEPTSGLSSNDAENIMRLLNEQTDNGKYVIINIHQPSSVIYKQIDQLLILDKGGFPIYYGKTIEAITYFKHIAGKIDSVLYECINCGNINPEDIFHIVEEKKTDVQGEYINIRKVEPQEWYKHYIENVNTIVLKELKNKAIPKVYFRITDKFSQFIIFFKRQILSKIADTQYLAMIILISPALGFILGFFCKYASGTPESGNKYLFINNINLPVYLFMSVISALFVGMIISAEEIHKDRKIREREKYISLSKVSYLNSKILYLFMISAIQIFLFVWVGNTIMQIKGMSFAHGLILFSTSCCANMIGLNISMAFKSLVAIYILIPLMLVPLILLSGIIVPFDKLHNLLKSEKYVPIIGEIMPSQWAFEALAVEQFSKNKYQKYWFDIEKRRSNTSYILYILIPFLSHTTNDLKQELNDGKLKTDDITVLNNGLKKLNIKISIPNNYKPIAKNFTLSNLEEISDYLNSCKLLLSEQMENIRTIIDNKYDVLLSRYNHNDEAILELKQQYYNNSLADYVLGNNEFKKMVIDHGEIIRKFEPIYDEPENLFGRTHFYSSLKRIGPLLIETFYFNIAMLWIISLLLYILLISEGLPRIINLLTLNIKHEK
jgi:ABC-type multidrug transport system ATPase subunit